MRRIRTTWSAVPGLLAQVGTGSTSGFTYDRIIDIAYDLVRLLLQVGEFVAVGFIVYYGLLMVVSRGDPGKFSTARKGLLWAVLGAIIMFGAYTIVNSIQAAVESGVR